LLDGLVVLGVALIAGAGITRAVVAAVSMTFVQFAIGAANDFVDAPADAGRKPGKPIPSGQVGRRLAPVVALVAAGSGIALAFAVDRALGALAVVVLLIGLAYDLRFKGTAWSWLPFAVGIPLLPVYGWLGAQSTLPVLFAVVVPIASVAGAGLAIANSIVDVERDRAAGGASVAVAIGPRSAGILALVLQVAVAGCALVAGAFIGLSGPWLVTVAVAGLALVAGAEWSRRVAGQGGVRVARREHAWRLQAIAGGSLVIAWLAAALEAGALES
jgi:4-hydroxybenzoate polyprenyltransferase